MRWGGNSLTTLHALLGFTALATAVHLLLWLPGMGPAGLRRFLWMAGLLALLTAGQNLYGWCLYPAYRAQVRPTLYAEHLAAARLFEVKEHLAWFALALTLAVAAVSLAARGALLQERALRLQLLVMLSGAVACVGVALGLGILVASVKSL